MRVTVRADEVKKDDKLPNDCRAIRDAKDAISAAYHTYIECEISGRLVGLILPSNWPVEVERPEPTVTVTVTLPPHAADYARTAPSSWAKEGFSSHYLIVGLVGRALREEKS